MTENLKDIDDNVVYRLKKETIYKKDKIKQIEFASPSPLQKKFLFNSKALIKNLCLDMASKMPSTETQESDNTDVGMDAALIKEILSYCDYDKIEAWWAEAFLFNVIYVNAENADFMLFESMYADDVTDAMAEYLATFIIPSLG